MRTILWIPIGAVALGVMTGAILGSRSRTLGARGGALMGFYLSLLATLPLLAIGLSTS